jgi:hypothetical protein
MVAINEVALSSWAGGLSITFFCYAGLVLVLHTIAAVATRKLLARHWAVPLLAAFAFIPLSAYLGRAYYGDLFTTDVGDTQGLPYYFMTWAVPPFFIAVGLGIYGMLGSMHHPERDPTDPRQWTLDGSSLGIGMYLELWTGVGFFLGGQALSLVDYTLVNYNTMLAFAVGGVVLVGIPLIINLVQVYNWVQRWNNKTLVPENFYMPGGHIWLCICAIFHWASKIVVIGLYAGSTFVQPTATTPMTITNALFQEGVGITLAITGGMFFLCIAAFSWFANDMEQWDGPSGKSKKMKGGKTYSKMTGVSTSAV